MSAKPKVVVFSIIPRLGELVKQLLPQEDISIVQYQAPMSAKYGRVVSEEEAAQLMDAEVLLADNNAFLQVSQRLPQLRWFQGTWAGVEGLAQHFGRKDPPPYLVSRMSSEIFNLLMAEYVVGQIIVHERGWRQADRHQAACRWEHSGRVAEYRTLRELTVALLGTGQIGLEIGRALKAGFGCRVLGYSRTPRDSVALQHALDAHYHGRDQLPQVLSASDYIVSCLPSTPDTVGLFTQELLSAAKPGSVFLNIGRGSVVTEAALVAALDGGPLESAVLDVFDTEPLPASSPLWTHPKVVITPHCAGVSRACDVAGTFVENYKRFIAGKTLQHLVDFERGY